MTNIARLRDFVRCFTRLADQAEQRIVDGRALLAEPIAHDDWLLPVPRNAISSACCTAIGSNVFR